MNLDARLELLERENDDLRAQVETLSAALTTTAHPAPFEWGLTRHEEMVFGALVNLPIATKEALLGALYWSRVSEDEVPEMKIIDVFVCKMRKKLTPFGVEIKTIWGRGYALAETDRNRFRQVAA